MYDHDLTVVKVFPAGKVGDRYLDAKEAAEAKLNGDPVVGLGAGDAAFYDFAQAKELGLCKPDPQNTLGEAIDDFKLPRAAVYPLLDQTTAYLVVARGEVNGQLKEDVKRRLNRALGDQATVIIIRLEVRAVQRRRRDRLQPRRLHRVSQEPGRPAGQDHRLCHP